MKVLVTGASGFLGSHLISALTDSGHSVRGLSRNSPDPSRRINKVEYITGVNVSAADTMTDEMFQGVDAVVHLVGIIQEGGNGQTFQRVHVYGTQNVIDFTRRAGISGQFIYISALGSSSDSPSEYSRTKHTAEQSLKNSDLSWTIFRPSLILGTDGEFVAQMKDLILHGGLPLPVPFPIIPVPGSGMNKFQPIYVDDLTSCIVKALSMPNTIGQTYEMGGASQVTFNDLLAGFANALHVKKPLVHMPIPIMRIVASVMEALLPKPPVTRDQLANLSLDNVTSSNAIVETFNVNPQSFQLTLNSIFGSNISSAEGSPSTAS